MKRPVHRIENWGERINEMIDELETKDYESNRRFSIKLGVVCHFVSDFFCLAHNDPYYRQQFVHFMYEARQAKKFVHLRKVCSTFDPLFSVPADMNAASYVSSRYSDFINGEISFEKELSYSVETCAVICSIMIAEGAFLPVNA